MDEIDKIPYYDRIKRKVIVKTVAEGMKGTIIATYEKGYMNYVHDVRLENGFLLKEVRSWEMELVK